MLKRKFLKTLTAFVLIVTLLMPYTSNVLGAISHTDVEADLTVLTLHEGGEESSGTLHRDYVDHYDTTPYKYQIAETTVFKIIEDGDTTYADALYCLDAEKSFPGILNNEQIGITYKNVADLKDDTDINVEALGLSNENYNALIWLVDNMYLRKQAPEQKDEFLKKAFKDYIENKGISLDEIKATLTDDDIEVIQQWAMWNFTNSDVAKYTSLGSISIYDPLSGKSGSYVTVAKDANRQIYASALYDYLVASAKAGVADDVKYPHIAVKADDITTTIDGEYYKVGPFKVESGNVDSASYKLELVDYNKNLIDRSAYEILIEGENAFTKKNVDQIFDTNYYIYLPMENNTIANLSLYLEYNKYQTKVTLWTASKDVYQPIALITRQPEKVPEEVGTEIPNLNYDLALRKYIVKVGDEDLNRRPVLDVKKLQSGEANTAEYKHKKSAVEVEAGATVVYEIAVYNEGTIDGTATKVVDYLPAGLTLKENSTINEAYGWVVEETNGYTKVVTEALKEEVIKAFDPAKSKVDSRTLQIECVVADDLKSGKVLTNVAEIVTDNITDRDSNEGSIDYTQINDNYSGNKNNKTDLTDSDYHYAGIEDDDDFEKLIVEGKTFDLNLKKFITKVNKVAPSTSREPVVDVTKLKNGSSTNADYKLVKTPITVEQGDIITYKIRVYNEGELAGYAEEVADHIPSGLGFLVNHTTNVDNYWKVSDEVKTVKLESVPNAIKNLSLDDFTSVTDLKNVDVVYDSKVVSTKLKSSDIDAKNLIDGFDPKTDTALDYKDIEVVCVVIDAQAANNNFKNIAEIQKHSDENKDEEVIDRDSVPGTVDPNNYPGNDNGQDDHDFEILNTVEPKEFDLSLQKIITKLNSTDVDRKLSVNKTADGKLTFAHTETPLAVAYGDLVTYRIYVFNEGEVAGYAEEIKDNLPEGLTFVKDHETNKAYGWKLYDKNGQETNDLAQAVTVKTNHLSKAKSADNIIKAFGDPTGVGELEGVGYLDYKYVEIVFKVETTSTKDIINIAEISDDADENGNPVDDRDSTPNNDKSNEDDIDEEKVKLQEFDLSLKKFITAVNNTSITDRVPKVNKGSNGALSYTTKKDPVKVANGDLVTYTIRVYNEGDMAGYAKEVADNLPEGLEFVKDNETNKKFGWKLYDANGKETADVANAKTVKTNYLSKDVNPSLVIAAYNKDAEVTDKNPAYQDLQIVFRVLEEKVKAGSREIKNIAEITDDTDSNGNPVTDKDSIPNNNKEGEDDIDTEVVYVKYFDLSLTKNLVKVIIIEDGQTREIAATKDLMKVEINRKKVNSTVVKFVYDITVKNEGEIAGYAKELTDYIPAGLEFIEADNKNWTKESDTVIKTKALENKLLNPGESASVQVVLKWKNAEDNLGQKVNVAEISQDANDANTKDVDSTPNNKVMTEDDIDDAPVILSISTGAEPVYLSLTLIVLTILAVGITLIKKYVLL